MTHIEDLLQRVNALRDLLMDPHPGLLAWRAAYDVTSNRILAFYGFGTAARQRIWDAAVQQTIGDMERAVQQKKSESLDALFRDLSEIVGNNEHLYDAGVQMVCGSIPDATGHSGDAICPECGSADPKAHYVPHDAYKACENIWHITEVRIPRRDR